MTNRLRRIMTIPTIKLVLETEKPLGFENSTGLRGFIGRLCPEDILIHSHGDGDLLYSYPRVQYKVTDSEVSILGLAEGVGVVKGIPRFEDITLGHEDVKIFDIRLSERESILGVSGTQRDYCFLTPWLALNEKNYEKYQRLGSWAARKELLEKILIGNIISMSKSLGYTVPAPIKANIHNLKEVKTSLKGTPMLGFLGTFSVNFEIPDYWGIGKSVSRGFGTVKRLNGGQ
jgi:hypothetical protein